MKCKECGCELEDGARFCASCGKEVIKEQHCSNCGKLLPEGVRFCSSCGPAVSEDKAEPAALPMVPSEDAVL